MHLASILIIYASQLKGEKKVLVYKKKILFTFKKLLRYVHCPVFCLSVSWLVSCSRQNAATANRMPQMANRRWSLYLCHTPSSVSISVTFLFFFLRPFCRFSNASSSAWNTHTLSQRLHQRESLITTLISTNPPKTILTLTCWVEEM